jgi:hypothetical protein
VTIQIYELSYLQVQNIGEYLAALNSVDSEDVTPFDDKKAFGSGYYAAIVGVIPVQSDASGADELLGWLVRGDHEWGFTQDPARASQDPSLYSISTPLKPPFASQPLPSP